MTAAGEEFEVGVADKRFFPLGISDSYMLEAIVSTSVAVDAHANQVVQEQAFTRKQQHEHNSST